MSSADARGETASPQTNRLERYALFDRVNRPYLCWQLDQFRSHLGQRVLEFGCGVGGIIELLEPRELVYGIDVDHEVLEYAAQRFRDRPECRFAEADVGALGPEILSELEAQRFDTVLCINMLEHVRDDIQLLQIIERLLMPEGTLALLVPAHLWLYGPYDRLDGHFRRYSKSYLRTILSHTGLRAERLYYFNFVGAMGWWWQYRLLKRTIHGEGQLGMMNRILPWVRRIESLMAPPFGLSLIAICRRPAGSP